GVIVSDVTHDSRQVRPGMLFACVAGANHDGHDFASEAVHAGAAALLVSRRLDSLTVPQLVVPDVRAALGPCAAAVHGHPSRRVCTIAVTGTAGKTTVSHALAAVLNAAGRRCAVLGTLHGTHTTPEATDLNRWLAARTAAGAGRPHAVVEVSSHALALGRVDAVEFAAGVFTNLSPEHLDFHGGMDAYFDAKVSLFDGRSALAVVNVGDEWGGRLRARIADRTPVHAYSPDDMTDVESSLAGLRFTWRGRRLASRLVGRANVENLAAVAATALALGLDEDAVAAGLEAVEPVPGRMQPVSAAAPGATVLVDYAHKPGALAAALAGARELTGVREPACDAGRLWVVFGAGGNRDHDKRAEMGRVAAELADVVVVTTDNPRTESAAAIAD
ncbi:MAG TPA: UDP-N-acetylmuramoyl-L-alanyl-D-glutamate--2,6-diaminopimelate ligase, partial [Acidimicrobiaceae bacterium]|nr:UDP-N-acetylmuramoyl-L-alanyl-D-glutamate--2,6-diaminopimelate ligase [Acidimicrobiaceae bacterium]